VRLTRETLTSKAASFWIISAVAWTVFAGLVTGIAWYGHWSGVGRFAFLDAAISFALAFGIWRRSLRWTWVALGYYLLNRAVDYFQQGTIPGSRAFIIVITYIFALQAIRLYPPNNSRQRMVVANSTEEDGTPVDHGAV